MYVFRFLESVACLEFGSDILQDWLFLDPIDPILVQMHIYPNTVVGNVRMTW